MACFFDLHSHMLCGVDDGATEREEMYAMLEMAYEDGVRALCLTPHYSPYLFGDTYVASENAFACLQEYVSEKHPDMQLFLGHELGYHERCLHSLTEGACRTIANSRYVLIDFPMASDFYEIRGAMQRLQSSGYFPILAHAERYSSLAKNLSWVEDFIAHGGVVQVNATSAIGAWGKDVQKLWTKLIRRGLVQVIASDGHDSAVRLPIISCCMEQLHKYCSEEQIRRMVWDNPWSIVRDQPLCP